MVTIQEARAQLTQAETQLQAQREKTTQAQARAQSQLRQLTVAQEKLPVATSQQALRQTMGGLAGQLKRKAIKKVREKILGQKTGLEKYKSDIATETQRLQAYEETQLKPARTQIKQAEEHDEARKLIERAASQGMVWAHAKYGEGIVRELAQKYMKQESLAREGFTRQIEKFEASNPTEKLIVDWKKMKVTGIQSGNLGQTLSLKEYNKYADGLKPETLESIQINEIAPQDIIVDAQPSLIRPTAKPTFFQKLKGALTSIAMPTVSALSSSNRDLSSIKVSQMDDISIPDRVLDRKDRGLDIITPIRDKLSDIGSDTFKGIKEGFQKEIFDPSTGTFQIVSADPQLGKGTTEIISVRLPTSQEQAKIDFSTKYDFSVKDISIRPNKEAIKNIEKFDTERNKNFKQWQNTRQVEIPKFEYENRENGDFDYNKLSKTKQSQYDRLIDKDNRELEKYQGSDTKYKQYVKDTSKTFKFANYYEKTIPVTELTSPFGYVAAGVGTAIGGIGRGVGTMYEDITSLTGKIKKDPFRATGQLVKGEITGTEFLSGFKKKEKPDAVYDMGLGIARVGTEADTLPPITGKAYVQPAEVEKVATGVYTAGSYLLPFGVGTGLFAAEVGESLSQVGYSPRRFIQEKPGEALLLGGLALGVGALKGVRVIENKAIQRAIIKEISALEKSKVPLKSFTVVDEASGLVAAKGSRTVKGVTEEVIYYGKIKQTEKGIKFIPSGEGAKIITGEVVPSIWGVKGRPRKFVSGTEFEFGARGKDILLGKLGKEFDIMGRPVLGTEGGVKVFEELGTTTVIPKTDYFGITALDRGRLTAKNIRELKKQLEKGTPSKDIITKDISIPTDQRNLFFEIKDTIGLRVNPQELGTVVRIPKKKDIDILGFKGKGKKSSDKFFKDLYAPQVKEKPILDLSIPRVSEISAKLKPMIKPKTKTTPVVALETPSAYAGTGLYERTEITTISPNLLSVDAQPALVERDVLSFQPKVDVAIRLKEFQVIGQKDVLGFKPAERLIAAKGLGVGISEAQKFETDLKVDTRARQETRQETRQSSKPKVPKPKVPKSPLLKIPFPSAEPKKKVRVSKKKKKKDEEFLGITKRFGKELIVGVGRTAAEAESLAKRDVLGSLGATVKVRTREGRQVQLTPGKFFRISKTDPLAIVQRKTRRLAARGERREIAKARRGKTKTKKVIKKRRKKK